MYNEQGEWVGSEEEQREWASGVPLEPSVSQYEAPGWYTDVDPYTGLGGYTGQPQTIEEAQYIRDYFKDYGVRPSAKEASDYMFGEYGQGFRGGMPAYDERLRYMPGSTMYEQGWRTGGGVGGYGGGGLAYGPYAGANVPYDTTVVKDIYGNPMQRFPTERAAQEAGYGADRYFERTAEGVYPQRPIRQPFKEPEKLTIEEFIERDPLEAYKHQVTAYLDKMFSGVEAEAIGPASYDSIIEYILEQINAGVPFYNLPYYDEVKNIMSGGLFTAYNNYLNTEYPAQVGAAQTEWQRQRSAAERPMMVGQRGPVGYTPQQRAEQEYTGVYQQLADSLGLDAKNRIWMDDNYSALIAAWLRVGQGMNFVDWVRSYLGNPQPNIRRYAPPVVNR